MPGKFLSHLAPRPHPTTAAAPELSNLQPSQPGTQNDARPDMASGLRCEGSLGMGVLGGQPRSWTEPSADLPALPSCHTEALQRHGRDRGLGRKGAGYRTLGRGVSTPGKSLKKRMVTGGWAATLGVGLTWMTTCLP